MSRAAAAAEGRARGLGAWAGLRLAGRAGQGGSRARTTTTAPSCRCPGIAMLCRRGTRTVSPCVPVVLINFRLFRVCEPVRTGKNLNVKKVSTKLDSKNMFAVRGRSVGFPNLVLCAVQVPRNVYWWRVRGRYKEKPLSSFPCFPLSLRPSSASGRFGGQIYRGWPDRGHKSKDVVTSRGTRGSGGERSGMYCGTAKGETIETSGAFCSGRDKTLCGGLGLKSLIMCIFGRKIAKIISRSLLF